MIYLIGQLSLWLLLAAVFAALAGWTFAAERSASAERALRRERDNLLRDLARLATDGEVPAGDANSEPDAARRLLDIRDARIAELEHALENARSRADLSASELAEAQRRMERDQDDAGELVRLRALAGDRDVGEARALEVDAAPVIDEAVALQAWRLRYFEQRVRYLEGRTPAAAAAAPNSGAALLEWRARDAEARASHLADELRAVSMPVARQSVDTKIESPFAASADVDALLRWRLLYLERRVAHLQANASKPGAAPAPEQPNATAPDPDRWKWRARYLEARVRHLEERPVVAAAPAPALPLAETVPQPAAPVPTPPVAARRAKPAVLGAARNGAPDDFTLIDGVSLLQQTTLYSLGIFHFHQIAAWSEENVAWVDNYLRLGGRIGDDEWVEQAAELAERGPAAARRTAENEDA